MTQLAERLRLDLADALAGDRETLADLFERVLAAVADPRAFGPARLAPPLACNSAHCDGTARVCEAQRA